MAIKKKVGIITMHKVPNFGSALQAYALQHKVDELGYDAELIDYHYPNKYHCAKQGLAYFPQRSTFRLFILNVIARLMLIAHVNKNRAKCEERIERYELQKNYRRFYRRYFKLSRFYDSIESICNNPPDYSIYMTGSDQVWNPRFVANDPVFFLDFAGVDKPRLSYAASMSNRKIDKEFEDLYKAYLQKYAAISVREKSTAEIVSRMTDRGVNVVCDPSLLLNKGEWLRICPKKPLVKESYLLLYIQSYSYDPYPHIVSFTKELAEKLGLKVVVLMGLRDGYSIDGAITFETAGPFEFLQLFRDARFVVTTSFHGTAFALNFGKDFYSVVKEINGDDCRIADFLRQCSAEHHLLEIDSLDHIENLPQANTAESEVQKLQEFRGQSLDFLREALRQ